MFANRIRNWKPAVRRAKSPSVSQSAAIVPLGFVVAPAFLMSQASAWQTQIYQAAYERARAAAEVPRHYRQFFSAWN